jgi:hypothetical protein
MLNIVSGLFSEGAPPVSPTSYESIQTVTVGSGGTAEIEFTSIPSTFKHLQIRGLFLSNTAEENLRVRFNSDSGTNYARHYLGGNGSSAFAAGTPNETYALAGLSPNSTQPAACVLDILDYGSTNKYKTTRSLYGDDKNGAGYVYLSSGLWQSTIAITSVELSFTSTSIFNEYSSFALYGIKG